MSHAVEDFGVNVDMLEGYISHVVEACEHHAGDPQSDDITGGDENRTGIEVVQHSVFAGVSSGIGIAGSEWWIVLAVRPSECGVWPEC